MALGKKGIGTGGAIVVVFVLGLLFVSAFVDLATCPKCGGTGKIPGWFPLTEETCPTCGGDGKITVLKYIMSITIMPQIQLATFIC